MTYEDTIERIVRIVEATGVTIMVAGGAVALATGIPAFLSPERRSTVYEQVRRNLGRVVLLGLEILIIGDIVRTIVVEPTFESVVVLGTIVVIRIVLSFALEVEIDGQWPWSRRSGPVPPRSSVRPLADPPDEPDGG